MSAPGRWELMSALAAACDSPSSGSVARQALGLESMPAEDHTRVFVMNLPPHASIYLGGEGQLGGEAADRVAGFWRAIGVSPDADPDHLSSLLALYAHLGAAADEPGLRPATRQAIIRRRQALLWEHLWPWVPAYTSAVESLGLDGFTQWARLLRRALSTGAAGAAAAVGERAALALRDAPPALDCGAGSAALLDALVAPVRCGFILTRQGLATAAATIAVGYRIGERRFALKAMFEQDFAATLTWLSEEAARWVAIHNEVDTTSRWWADRAANSAALLRQLAATTDEGRPDARTALRMS